MRIEMKASVEMTPELMAQIFCGMNDEQQCQFFVDIGRFIVNNGGQAKWDMQWCYLGGHLRSCECSTAEAREFITTLYEFMQTSTHT